MLPGLVALPTRPHSSIHNLLTQLLYSPTVNILYDTVHCQTKKPTLAHYC